MKKDRSIILFRWMRSLLSLAVLGQIHLGEAAGREVLNTFIYQTNQQENLQVITKIATTYDREGKLEAAIKPVKTRVTQDGFSGSRLQTQDSRSDSIDYTYDGLGRQKSIHFINAAGEREDESMAYQVFADKSCSTRHYPANDASKTTCSDALGREIARYNSVYGTQPTVQTSYNDLGQAQRQSTIDGSVHTYTYDAQRHLLETTDAMQGQAVQLFHINAYDAVTNTVTHYTKGRDGKQSVHVIKQYNDANKLIQRRLLPTDSNADNTIDISMRIDNFGQVTQTLVPRLGSQQETTVRYDSQGLPITTLSKALAPRSGITPDMSLKIHFDYDGLTQKRQSKTLTVVDSQGNPKPNYAVIQRYRKQFSAAGQLLQETLLNGSAQQPANEALYKRYHYDQQGNISAVDDWQSTAGVGQTAARSRLTYGYENILGKDRCSLVEVPAYTDAHGHHYAAYHLVTVYDPATSNVTDTYKLFAHDNYHYAAIHYDYAAKTQRLRQKTYVNENKHILYRYDPATGHLLSTTNPLGYVTTYRYGSATQPQQLNSTLRHVILYQPDGKPLIGIDYQMDSLQRLSYKYRYRYDSQGHKQLIDIYRYQYNSQGFETDISHKKNNQYGSNIETMHYDFARNGNLQHENYRIGGNDNDSDNYWYYDNLNRLVGSRQMTRENATQTTTRTDYIVDANNNVINEQVSTNRVGQEGFRIQSVQPQVFTYDALDQVSQTTDQVSPLTYDKQTGDLLQDGQNDQYDYNATHKLTHLYQDGRLIASYTYASDGMRASKQGYDSNGHPLTFHYYYDHQALLASDTDEIDGQAHVVHNHAFYLFGNQREARLVIKAGGQPIIRFYGVDRQSISNTLTLDQQGQSHSRYYRYQAYGQRVANSVSSSALSIDYDPYQSFTEYTEQESQGRLQYRPARELLTPLHQFTSLDSDSRFNNRYGYADANPIMKVDPSGNNAERLFGSIVVTALGMTIPLKGKWSGIRGRLGRVTAEGEAVAGGFGKWLGESMFFNVAGFLFYNAANLWNAVHADNPQQADGVLKLAAAGASALVGMAFSTLSLGLSTGLRAKIGGAYGNDMFQGLQPGQPHLNYL